MKKLIQRLTCVLRGHRKKMTRTGDMWALYCPRCKKVWRFTETNTGLTTFMYRRD